MKLKEVRKVSGILVTKEEMFEVLSALLNMMEEELERERLSLPLCDAWLNVEDMLCELELEVKEGN